MTSDAELGREMQALAARLEAIASELAPGTGTAEARTKAQEIKSRLDDQILAGMALTIYNARQRRDRYFGIGMFGEPAWDMLLDLFVKRASGSQVSTTSLCIAAGATPSTGTRVILLLEDKGLLERTRASDDRRVIFVDLTDKGYELMRTYLTEGVMRDEMPSGAS